MIDTSKKRHRLRIVIPAFPAFNIYSHIAKRTTALGPVCVATNAQEVKNWDVEVIDENNLRQYGPRGKVSGANHEFLEKERPTDVAGFYGGLTSTIPRLYKLAKFYKEKGAITIAGGQHFVEENIEEALASGVDYVAIGEGEETIKEFLEAIEKGEGVEDVKGLAYLKNGKVVFTPRREALTDFDKLPIPNFSLLRYARIKVYPVERIRGCGMNCEFCTVKGRPRCAAPERLLESIKLLVETKDARHFFVVDDLFGQQRDETIRFCKMLKEYQLDAGRRLDITVQIRLDKAHDTELLTAMRQAGINTVAIGFESPIQEELEAMKKQIKPQDMIKLARVFHKFGFLVHGMFIFGYPLKDGARLKMSSRERIKRYRDFIKKAKIDSIQVLLPGPLPGTELRHRLEKQGRVYPKNDVGWEYYDGNFPLFEPDEPLTAEELQMSSQKIMGSFYQFKNMLKIVIHVFWFPAIIFFLHNIKTGWRRWYRHWRNTLLRSGGWVIMKGWTRQFNKDKFFEKIHNAQKHIGAKK